VKAKRLSAPFNVKYFEIKTSKGIETIQRLHIGDTIERHFYSPDGISKKARSRLVFNPPDEILSNSDDDSTSEEEEQLSNDNDNECSECSLRKGHRHKDLSQRGTRKNEKEHTLTWLHMCHDDDCDKCIKGTIKGKGLRELSQEQ
jgi:hypothetical protein